MRDDPTLEVIARLEETPTIRPAFTEALRHELHRELGFAGATVAGPVPLGGPGPVASGQPALKRFVPSFRPLTLRAVVLAVLALVLVAGTALAVYVIARAWLSAGVRGPQYTNDYSLSEVYREPDAMYDDVHLAATGDSLVAFHQPFTRPWGSSDDDPREWAIVRIPLDGSGAAETILPLEDLRHAIAWDDGVDVARGFVQRSPTSVGGDLLGVASNGDLFASVSLTPTDDGAIAASSALVVIHPDGKAQTIVTVRELADEGLLAPLGASNGMAVAGTPSSPDRLWVRAEANVESGSPGTAVWLYEIVDPDRDGDWSDRVIHPIKLPASIPVVDYATYDWIYGPFEAEPSTPQTDRSSSILLPLTSKSGEYRVYRITDRDGDGDVTQPDETELLLSDPRVNPDRMLPVALSARVGTDENGAASEELILGGLTRATHVSRATSSGLQDILRALPTSVDSVEAETDGTIYVTSQAEATSESGWAWVVYRLTPVEIGASAPPGAITPAPASTTPDPSSTSPTPTSTALGGVSIGRVTPGVSQMRFGLGDPDARTMVLLGADGSGPEVLLPGVHPLDPCRSTDGSKVAYLSDDEVPNEPFIYVASADGTHVTKMDEAYSGFECPFSPDAIVLATDQMRYVRHDLRSGAEAVILEGGPGFISPDGRTLVTLHGEVIGPSGINSTISLVDVASGAIRKVEGRYADGNGIGTISWAPDGRRLAFIVSRGSLEQASPKDMYVVEVDGRRPRLVTTFTGLDPDLAWSADGLTVTALVPSVIYRPDGTYTIISVDLRTGATSTLEDTGAKWAAWSPVDVNALAYATLDGLFVVRDGQTRRLASVADTAGETGDEAVSRFAIGWSPDGRWLGRVEPGTISVIDVATGVETPIWSDPPGIDRGYPWWWR